MDRETVSGGQEAKLCFYTHTRHTSLCNVVFRITLYFLLNIIRFTASIDSILPLTVDMRPILHTKPKEGRRNGEDE